MHEQSATSNASRRRFLRVAGTLAASGPLGFGTASAIAQPVPQPPVNADHPVTIYLAPNNSVSYKEGANSGDPLTVSPNQTVVWKAITPGKKYHVTIIFKSKKSPFVDANGDPVYAVHGSEQDEGTLKIGGKIGQGALGHSYKYSVAVFDDVTNKTYSDDPKIIVGTGFDEARNALTAALGEVKEADVALSDRPKQQEQAKSIENQLEHLLVELK
jgi:hypothetical protein